MLKCYFTPIRVTLFCMVVYLTTFASATAASSQDTAHISLHIEDQTFDHIFKEIERQTSLTFFYSVSTLDGKARTSIDLARKPLSKVLELLLKDRNVEWSITGKGIVLKKAYENPRSAVTDIDSVPNINIRGVVTDRKGVPIPGATVSLKGMTRGQGTDGQGQFNFSNVPGNVTLMVSSIGFEARQVKMQGQSYVQVHLDSAIREIKGVEIVSTGYQSIPRERATGSFVHLDNAIINRSPSPNALERILNITSSLKFEPNGAVNDAENSTSMTIRGFSTINANMRPLIVVDGFPYDEFNTGGSTILNYNPLSNINPNDIESITVLRDAAAASIWGSRSGNGVIVITTKKGRLNQKNTIQFNSNLTVFENPRLSKLTLASSKDMVDFEKNQFSKGVYNDYDDVYASLGYLPSLPSAVEIMLAQRRGAITPAAANAQLSALSQHDVRDDIDKYLVQRQVVQQYNLNLSGGSNKYSYYTSIGFDKSRSAAIGNSYSKATVRLQNTFRPKKWVEVTGYLNYVNSSNKNNAVSYESLVASGLNQASPYAMLADAVGNPLHVPTAATLRTSYIDTLSGKGLKDWHYRPLQEAMLNDNKSSFSSVRIGGDVSFTILQGLELESKVQYEKGTEEVTTLQDVSGYAMRDRINAFMYYDPSGVPVYPFPVGGTLITSLLNRRSVNFRNQVNLNRNWGIHQLNLIAGYEVSETKRDVNMDVKYGFDKDKYTFRTDVNYNVPYLIRPSGALGMIPNLESMVKYTDRAQSYYANAGYTLNNKYTVTMSGRVDASNFLGSKRRNRHIPLYSAGFGWNISNESFYNVNWLPALKMRATYGYNGNMNNKATAYATAGYAVGDAHYGLHTEPILRLGTAPNPGLGWEKVEVVNLGVDFSSRKNIISGTIEYYTKHGKDLIGEIVTEPTTGVVSYIGNYADMRGSGLDISINSTNINRKFVWTTAFLLSTNRDKVTNYEVSDINRNTTSEYFTNKPVVGKPLLKLYAYRFGGLDPENGSPRGVVKGGNVDYLTAINESKPEDLIYFGSMVPRYFGSMINTFGYGGLSLSFTVSYKLNYHFRRKMLSYSNVYNNWGGHSDYALRWRNKGDESFTNVPSLPDVSDPARDDFYEKSELSVLNGGHIRLQDVKLSADLLTWIGRNKRLENLNAFVYLNNLGILWRKNKDGIDPDFSNTYTLPPAKSITLGISVGL